MASHTSLAKLLLVGASCAVIAACSDASISSPGEGQLPQPPSGGGGGGGGGGGAISVDRVPTGGCPGGFSRNTVTLPGGSVEVTACETSGTLTVDADLPGTAANGQPAVYFLNGAVFVGQDQGGDSASGGAGATLTIGAGARIVGANPADYLVVSRGNELVAEGTQFNPILFTSADDLEASLSGSPRTADNTTNAEWGGLIINGRAPINACDDPAATGGTAQCEKEGEGDSRLFGGNDPADGSGSLRYLQVRYAGFEVTAGNELNGIAFQGTGSNTEVEYIQVHNNFDDGIEFFGGTTDAKYVVLTGNGDDSFDVTDGWVGNSQFVLVIQNTTNGDNGFEMDNFEDFDDRLPRSNPTIANFTLLGEQNDGMRLREGLAGDFVNGVVVGFQGACVDVDDASSHAQANAGNLTLRSTLFDCPTPFEQDDTPAFSEQAWFNGQADNIVTSNSLVGVFPGPTELAVDAVDPSTDSQIDASRRAFFDSVDYIGAFGPTETASNSWATGWTFGVFEEADTCPTGTTEGTPIGGQLVCRLTGVVTSDVQLVRGPLYELVGAVFVGADRGGDPANPLPSGVEATLTVDPGVTIFGSSGADYLVVARGSELESNGTVGAPVIWTSRDDVEALAANNPRSFTSPENAEWGGLVINGRAPINACDDPAATGGTADCEKEGEGDSRLFGGNDANDGSGSLRYTQVRYAGFEVTSGNELNGIAFQGTGDQTDVNFIQVHNNFDDGIEFFGGTTNAKHVVLTGNGDDSFDVTDGWVGNSQFVIVVQSTVNGDNGFEMDNFEDFDDRLPRSNPTIANYTLIGEQNDGMRLREGLAGDFVNGVVVGFQGACLDVDDSSTHAQANAGNLTMRSTLFDCPTPFEGDDTPAFSEATFFNTQANNVVATNTLTDLVVPGSAENGVTAVDPSTDASIDASRRAFFDSVNYIGAVEDANDDWYKGWTFGPAEFQ